MKIEIEISDRIIWNTLISGVVGWMTRSWCARTDQEGEIFDEKSGQFRDQAAVLFYMRADDGELPVGHRLDTAAIKRGLAVMATQTPHQFGDMLAGDGDAITGDVLIQCCLFGEVVYQ